ncbi:MAG TPA: hypothetical protein VFK97_01305, partial [Candidatus Saccharimonadales bacterium]|nr:hypothetical protein [Candidatus Saccharimonadales bacterium]
MSLGPPKALAANPATISFQGKVVNSNGTNVTDGTYSFVFRIYNTSAPTMTTACTSTASCLWQETQASVTVTSGIFQVELGSSCALTSGSCNNSAGGPINFSSSNSLYLTLQFNGDTSGTNGGFMSPLIHITSVPFALQADNSASLGGIAASGFVQLGATQSGNINIGSGTITSGAINGQTIGSASTLNGTLTVQGASALTLGSTSNVGASLFQDGTANNRAITLNGQALAASYTLTLPAAGVTGAQCLQSTSGSTTSVTVLTFGSCGAGGGSLSADYNSSATTGNTITLSNSGLGVIIKDAASSSITNLLAVQNNGGTSTYFAVTAANSGSIIVGSAANAVTIASGSITTASGNLQVYGAGTTTIGNGTGAINLTAGTGSAVNITALANSTWQVQGTSLILDTQSASNSTLTVSNSGAGTITLALDSGGVYAVGGSNGSSVGACSSSQAVVSYQSVGGIIVAGSCGGIILNQSGAQSSSQFHISGTGLSDTGFQAPYIDAQSTAGALGLGNTNAGAITIGNTANSTGTTIISKSSTTAFQLQNQSSANILSVDTTASLASSNLVANPSFETTISGSGAGIWVKKIGTETSIGNNTSNFYNQLNSVKIVTTAVANQGIKQQLNSTLSASTAYNVIFYAKLDPA